MSSREILAGGSPILVVVAHPDDEVLGFGGTAHLLAKAGASVQACILAGAADARHQRPTDEGLLSDTHEASRRVGMAEPIIGAFPNIRMNTVAHLELVQFIEGAIIAQCATRIFTHHPGDINDDHRQAARATQAAARLSQRRSDVPALQSLHYMEIPSSTDWSFAGDGRFDPDSFVEIGNAGVSAKLTALAAYRNVMRPYPHPRSVEAIKGLATYRGGQAGLDRAEAFQTGYMNLSSLLA